LEGLGGFTISNKSTKLLQAQETRLFDLSEKQKMHFDVKMYLKFVFEVWSIKYETS
jgi:hypothetical protein